MFPASDKYPEGAGMSTGKFPRSGPRSGPPDYPVIVSDYAKGENTLIGTGQFPDAGGRSGNYELLENTPTGGQLFDTDKYL